MTKSLLSLKPEAPTWTFTCPYCESKSYDHKQAKECRNECAKTKKEQGEKNESD